MMSTKIQFPVMRYQFVFIMEQKVRFPEYAGSLLRGIFGASLRQLACITRESTCEGCFLKDTCAYKQIFEPESVGLHKLEKKSNIPVPYIIEPPEWGVKFYEPSEPLVFHMVLMGKCLEHLPLIIMAWQRAFAKGVGSARAKGKLESVNKDIMFLDGTPIKQVYSPENGEIISHNKHVTVGEDLKKSEINFTIQTPMLLQAQGRSVLIEELTPRLFVRALVRRINQLSEFHGSGKMIENISDILNAADEMRSEKKLHWYSWTRSSARQRRVMDFRGIKGQWRIIGDSSDLMIYLLLGQILHVGKETAFGMGKYRLE